jgi:hypothetical protein
MEHKSKVRKLRIEGNLDDEDYQEEKQEVDSKLTDVNTELSILDSQPQNLDSCLAHCRTILENLAEIWLRGDIDLRRRF